ncbi:MAG TPA: peptidase S10 [Methylomirabilota bacterium]|nr:peptidase S10 [Methylomirabilota bacterium]
MRFLTIPAWLAALLLTAIITATAADAEKKEEPKRDADDLVVTTNSVTIAGQKIEYLSTAGTITLKDAEEKPRASFFFIAYTRTNGPSGKPRPLTFSFNGGPGSSSVWLHMGVLGPRRAPLKEDGSLPPPPYPPVENPFSLLDETDLVFIDPVSTGFSRAIPVKEANKFHGVSEDVESVADFIRLYVTRYQRWASPKFLIGESYGTTRAAGLANHLQDRHGMYLNGVMLVSTVLDFKTLSFEEGNESGFILFLPTYTATAWYHKQLPENYQADLPAALRAAEEFALGPYTQALMKGGALTPAEREDIAARLAALTGLSKEFVLNSNLRIRAQHFFKELLRDQRKTVGRFDSRYIGQDETASGATAEYDPSYVAVQGPFTGAFNHYLRAELNYKSDLVYEILNGLYGSWNLGDRFKGRFVNVTADLRQAMRKNPYLHVYVANGIYDLATPYLAAKQTFKEIDFTGELQKRVTIIDYPAGHMMYVHQPTLEKMKKDLAAFLQQSLNQK